MKKLCGFISDNFEDLQLAAANRLEGSSRPGFIDLNCPLEAELNSYTGREAVRIMYMTEALVLELKKGNYPRDVDRLFEPIWNMVFNQIANIFYRR